MGLSCLGGAAFETSNAEPESIVPEGVDRLKVSLHKQRFTGISFLERKQPMGKPLLR